jgi:hypothetical protein
VTDTSYDVAEACKNIPYTLRPNVNDTLVLTLAPSVSRSLRVTVLDNSGVEISNADVTLSEGAFTQTQITSVCGQVFFNSGIAASANYSVDVRAFGYTSQTVTPIDITGTESLVVTLAAS